MKPDTENKQRVEKLAEHIARQIRDLSLSYLPEIEEAGTKSEKGQAKVSFTLDWIAGDYSPKITTKISFSVSTKDETESVVDLEQASFFEGMESVDKVTVKVGDGPEVTLVNHWVDASERLADDSILVEIEDQDGENFPGCFTVDEELDTTVFVCEDGGGVILVENIAKWRHLDGE